MTVTKDTKEFVLNYGWAWVVRSTFKNPVLVYLNVNNGFSDLNDCAIPKLFKRKEHAKNYLKDNNINTYNTSIEKFEIKLFLREVNHYPIKMERIYLFTNVIGRDFVNTFRVENYEWDIDTKKELCKKVLDNLINNTVNLKDTKLARNFSLNSNTYLGYSAICGLFI